MQILDFDRGTNFPGSIVLKDYILGEGNIMEDAIPPYPRGWGILAYFS